MSLSLVALSATLAALLAFFYRRQRVLQRAVHIRTAILPNGLFDKLRQRHPALTGKDCQLVAQGLRQYFLTYLHSGFRPVAMPSQVVDDLWHEFILHTRHYELFCRAAFGRFLHHTPATALGPNRSGNTGLRRCYWFACRDENINPRRATRLPLLFAIDAKLAIAGGFFYVRDCSALRKEKPGQTAIHCGGDFSDAGYDGGTEGFGDAGGDGGGGGGLFGGDGGDGGGGHGDGGSGGSSCGGGGCGGGE